MEEEVEEEIRAPEATKGVTLDPPEVPPSLQEVPPLPKQPPWTQVGMQRNTAADTLHTHLGPWRLLGEGGDLLQTGGDLLGLQSYPLGSLQGPDFHLLLHNVPLEALDLPHDLHS